MDCSVQVGGLAQVGTPSEQTPVVAAANSNAPNERHCRGGRDSRPRKAVISTQEDLIWTKKPMSVAISNRLNALNSHELLARATDQT